MATSYPLQTPPYPRCCSPLPSYACLFILLFYSEDFDMQHDIVRLHPCHPCDAPPPLRCCNSHSHRHVRSFPLFILSILTCDTPGFTLRLHFHRRYMGPIFPAAILEKPSKVNKIPFRRISLLITQRRINILNVL
jgi:hypothetical protein